LIPHIIFDELNLLSVNMAWLAYCVQPTMAAA